MVENSRRKSHREFKMTRAGFTSGMGKYYGAPWICGVIKKSIISKIWLP